MANLEHPIGQKFTVAEGLRLKAMGSVVALLTRMDPSVLEGYESTIADVSFAKRERLSLRYL